MRVIFMGSPEFSVGALRALHTAGHDIICVYSQPPRPKGRGQALEKTAVHLAAEQMRLLVRTPPTFKDPNAVAAFQALHADIAVVAAYGLILRQPILSAPRLGCINIHASLLPRWRGAAPIQRAIEAGDTVTGITTMQMDVGLDTGAMLLRYETPIAADDTAQMLHDRLADIGAALIVETLQNIDTITPVTQPEEGVTYAHKLTKDNAMIDWRMDAAAIERRLRAFTPWPGLSFVLGDEVLRVHAAHVVHDMSGVAGTILATPLVVACGDGTALAIDVIQRAGRKPQPIAEFCRGFNVNVGQQCHVGS